MLASLNLSWFNESVHPPSPPQVTPLVRGRLLGLLFWVLTLSIDPWLLFCLDSTYGSSIFIEALASYSGNIFLSPLLHWLLLFWVPNCALLCFLFVANCLACWLWATTGAARRSFRSRRHACWPFWLWDRFHLLSWEWLWSRLMWLIPRKIILLVFLWIWNKCFWFSHVIYSSFCDENSIMSDLFRLLAWGLGLPSHAGPLGPAMHPWSMARSSAPLYLSFQIEPKSHKKENFITTFHSSKKFQLQCYNWPIHNKKRVWMPLQLSIYLQSL